MRTSPRAAASRLRNLGTSFEHVEGAANEPPCTFGVRLRKLVEKAAAVERWARAVKRSSQRRAGGMSQDIVTGGQK